MTETQRSVAPRVYLSYGISKSDEDWGLELSAGIDPSNVPEDHAIIEMPATLLYVVYMHVSLGKKKQRARRRGDAATAAAALKRFSDGCLRYLSDPRVKEHTVHRVQKKKK